MSSDLRRAGIDPDHWYGVARGSELETVALLPVTLWQREIVLFRDRGGAPVALEDRCPHRHVRLSHGRLVADTLECAYHGWRIDTSGTCVAVPYLEDGAAPPACRIRRYPVIERHGFLWLFPGDPARADRVAPLGVPEWDALDQVASVTTMELEAHYSFVVENLMNMHHGHLHARSQAWSDASLRLLWTGADRIDALYDAFTFLSVRSILSPAQLLLPFLRRRRRCG